jgi:diguanylate cyclase (GGDEF)-like protein
VQLGRDASCEIELHDDSVSRKHAAIEPVAEGYLLTDLASRNGTYLNDQRIDARMLQNGDRIRLGNQILKFLSTDRIEADYHETVYKFMTTDGLTQVHNKRYLLEVLERECHRARRTSRPLSLLLMDLDRFKLINDTYGHLAGDEVLAEFCRRCRELLRRDEVLARYGGEEFALLMADTPIGTAYEVAERIRQAVAQSTFKTEQADIPVTVSMGAAETLGEGEAAAQELIQRADGLLYAAKQAGRNRVMV